MPNPAGAIDAVRGHRTKAEVAARKRAEEGLLTGQQLKEDPRVKENPVAHTVFLQTKKLMAAIGRDDALYGAQINRYALLTAECAEYENRGLYFWKQLKDFQEKKNDLISKEEMSYGEAIKIEQTYQANILSMDRQVQQKRKMLFDIEKENCMSVASSLRSIPKTPDKSVVNPILEALRS